MNKAIPWGKKAINCGKVAEHIILFAVAIYIIEITIAHIVINLIVMPSFGGNSGGAKGRPPPTFRKIGNLSEIFGYVGILKANEYTEIL